MSDTVNKYFKQFYPPDLSRGWDQFEFSTMLGGMEKYKGGFDKTIFPRMTCTDGFSMSVQGHFGAYSTPRDDFAEHYTAVEVGFPSEREPLLMPFAENGEAPTETVYGYVPVEIVVAAIERHGGLMEQTP